MKPGSGPQLARFAYEQKLFGLSPASLKAVAERRRGYGLSKAHRFLEFQARIDRELLQHPVISRNPYTAWFSRGDQSLAQIRAFVVQFSVFSNRFLLAQLLKMINAESLEEMRASKEILANEIGVVFNPGSNGRTPAETSGRDCDPALVSTRGSVEGGVFRFKAGHFEWLLAIAEKLELGFAELGQYHLGTQATRRFCDRLARLYGSEEYQVSQAASYAVENWAAAGFWDQLVEGFERFNQRSGMELPLAFFTWHSRLEAQHASHTHEELEALYFSTDLNEDLFIYRGNEMLDGVELFWKGLETQRKAIQS